MQDPNKFLKLAVDRIIDSINQQQLSPHEAVVKTAKEMDMNFNFIKRACEVINVALTFEHFRKHADAKDADFPIVDAQQVSADVYAGPSKTAQQRKSEMFAGTKVSEEVPNFKKAKHDAKHKEARAALLQLKDAPQQMSEHGVAEKAGLAKLALDRHLDESRTEVVEAKQKLASKFASLVNHWSRDPHYRAAFSDFESQVFSKFGSDAVPYLDLIHSTAGCKEARGAHDEKHVMFDDLPELEMFSEFWKAAAEVPVKLQKLAEAADAILYVEQKKQETYHKIAEAHREQRESAPPVEGEKEAAEAPVEQEVEDPVMVAALRKQAEKEKEKQAGMGSEAVKGLFSPFIDAYRAPSKGGGNSSGSVNLTRKLLLQNLIATDPILGSYDPKRVTDAYEQFMRLAPELSNEKEVVRSHLRQMVASQAMTAFDAAQLMDADSKLRNLHTVQRGGAATGVHK